jgi:hypothetical protein
MVNKTSKSDRRFQQTAHILLWDHTMSQPRWSGTVYLHQCENLNSSKRPTWDLWMENAQASRSGICLRDRSAPPPVLTTHRSGFIAVSFFEQNRTTGRPKNHKEFGVTATTWKMRYGKRSSLQFGCSGTWWRVGWISHRHHPMLLTLSTNVSKLHLVVYQHTHNVFVLHLRSGKVTKIHKIT